MMGVRKPYTNLPKSLRLQKTQRGVSFAGFQHPLHRSADRKYTFFYVKFEERLNIAFSRDSMFKKIFMDGPSIFF
jgi:hypothetical protein